MNRSPAHLSKTLTLAVVGASVCLPAALLAQQGSGQGSALSSGVRQSPNGGLARPAYVDPSNLQEVDQRFDDVGPLRLSTRRLNTDLKTPTGFGSVYRLPASDRFGRQGAYARFDSGLVAVFPRSVYVQTQQGTQAPVPPGTVYYIGGIPADALSTAPTAAPPTMVDGSADLQVHTAVNTSATMRPANPGHGSPDQQGVRGESKPQPEAPTLFNDESYRTGRVQNLIMSAAAAATPSR